MDGSRLGGIFLERQVSPAGMIVVDVFAQDLSRVPIVEDDHVVEALAANASNDSFDVRLCHGERGAVRTCWMPSPATRRLKYAP